MSKCEYFVGVDVGSKSVRAGLFTDAGKLVNFSATPISIRNVKPDYYEQNSTEIWNAVSTAVKAAVSEEYSKSVKGLGFDATCSLVVLDELFRPLPVSPDQGADIYNTVMWMDHRAKKETEEINSKSYKCLKYVGEKMSLEMEIPKLFWLKRNMSKEWESARHFFDLPDFLTFKASGNLSRSLCSLVCKWTYMANGQKKEWDEKLFSDIGLHDLLENNCSKIGNVIYSPGEFVGGLTKDAADDLGLPEGIAVGASIIDAHAGSLALLFSSFKTTDCAQDIVCRRLGLIGGTSTCHMHLSKEPVFIKGVWGPYYSAMIPNYWLAEGGQSATGSLVDHIIDNHPAANLCPKNLVTYNWLENILQEMAKRAQVDDVSYLTKEIHVYPDFHGNRSPLADSSLRGMICGLSLDNGPESLALLYLATLQSLAYGTKDIVNKLTSSGREIDTVVMCGGLSNSNIFIQINADVLGLSVLIPSTKESVLLGASMLGAAASGALGTTNTLLVAQKMAGGAETCYPNKEISRFHEKKFEVFKLMQTNQYDYKKIMLMEKGK